MTPKTLITAATAGVLLLGAGAAFAQNYDPQSRKELDPRSVSANNPILWQRDARGVLILDSRGEPIPVNSSYQGEPAFGPAPVSVNVNASATAPSTASYAMPARVEMIASKPVPDTPANRAAYGGPMSHGGKSTPARGN